MDEQTKEKKDEQNAYDEHLKGTFVSVLLIGASIILSWLIVFYFYITVI